MRLVLQRNKYWRIAKLHCELAECLATAALAASNKTDSLPLVLQAHQHMVQALELNANYTRAAWGLWQWSNLYLQLLLLFLWR